MDNRTALLYQSPRTVFTNKDLAIMWSENNADNLKASIAYYVKKGVLNRLSRGVFSRDDGYNPKELATSLYSPSYISFETVLRESGVIFQHYDTFFAAGRWSMTRKCDRYTFTYRRLKEEVLFNPSGILRGNGFDAASRERAFLDMIYLFPAYHFDNLRDMDWQTCFDLAGIYKNKQLTRRLNVYFKNHAE